MLGSDILKTLSKQLYYKEFTFPVAYTGEVIKGYIDIHMHFDFEEWLRFSVSVPDYACCDKNIFKALIRVLEHSTVGYGKYQILKEDCRNKGFWKNL